LTINGAKEINQMFLINNKCGGKEKKIKIKIKINKRTPYI
jgi:hypothetical protein